MLLQIETDKVTIDVRYTETSPGKIKEYLVSEDDTVTVGQQVCIVDKGNTEGAVEGNWPQSYTLLQAALHLAPANQDEHPERASPTLDRFMPVLEPLLATHMQNLQEISAITQRSRRWWR